MPCSMSFTYSSGLIRAKWAHGSTLRAKSPQTWGPENEPLHAGLFKVPCVCLKCPTMCLGRPVCVVWPGVQAGLSAPLTSLALGRVPSRSVKNAQPAGQKQFPLDRSSSHRSPLDLVSQAPLEGAFIFLTSFIPEVKSHQIEAAFWLLLEPLCGSASSPPLRPP